MHVALSLGACFALLARVPAAVPHGPGAPGPASAAALRPAPFRWGATGHEMAARAAVEHLPTAMPAFFRDAADQLVYLDPEPDRWRSRDLREMDQAFSYDHYIDLENVPAQALAAPDRYAYLRALSQAGVQRPEQDGGLLPFRILEIYERLITEWRLWRAERDPRRRGWIEARIVNDAGVLGHYVTDAANPHHTTIHHNGWADGVANPQGYTTDRHFHNRFETAFVEAHVHQQDVSSRVTGEATSVAGHARDAVIRHIRASHDQVETLYRLEKQIGFDPTGPAHPETVSFAAERLAAGADMLRTLWWSAWLESASPPGAR
jgi:hypothetical protein